MIKEYLSWQFASKVIKGLFYILLATVASLFVAVTVNINPVYSLVLLLPLGLVTLWLLPDTDKYPHNFLMGLFYLWFILSILWPYYIVFAFPGLWDLYPARLLLALLLIASIYFLSKSTQLKHNLHGLYSSYRIIFIFFIFILLNKLLSIFLGESPSFAANAFIKELSEVFIPVILVMALFASKKSVLRFIDVLAILGFIVVAVGLVEYSLQQNVFQYFLPSWLFSSQEYIQNAMAAKIRGEYRLQSVFGHPIVLGQFLVVVLPIFIYKLFAVKGFWSKFFIFLMIPPTLFVMFYTGSRSVFAGIFAELIIFGILFVYKVLNIHRTSFIGWLFVIVSPAILMLVFLLAFTSNELLMGQTARELNSTMSRIAMWNQGLDILYSDPLAALFGHGLGRSALVLGWITNGILTIDSYFLSVLLDGGFPGLFFFISFFVLVFYSVLAVIKKQGFSDPVPIVLIISIWGYITVAFILSLTHILKVLYILTSLLLIYNMLTLKGSKQP